MTWSQSTQILLKSTTFPLANSSMTLQRPRFYSRMIYDYFCEFTNFRLYVLHKYVVTICMLPITQQQVMSPDQRAVPQRTSFCNSKSIPDISMISDTSMSIENSMVKIIPKKLTFKYLISKISLYLDTSCRHRMHFHSNIPTFQVHSYIPLACTTLLNNSDQHTLIETNAKQQQQSVENQSPEIIAIHNQITTEHIYLRLIQAY